MNFNPFDQMQVEEEPYYKQKFNQIKQTSIFNLTISGKHLFEYDKELYFYLIKYPSETISIFDDVINRIYSTEYDPETFNIIRTRIKDLNRSRNMRMLNPSDINNGLLLVNLIPIEPLLISAWIYSFAWTSVE